MKKEIIVVECECGRVWEMDYDPTPEWCVGEVWRLGVAYSEEWTRDSVDWGSWVNELGVVIDV